MLSTHLVHFLPTRGILPIASCRCLSLYRCRSVTSSTSYTYDTRVAKNVDAARVNWQIEDEKISSETKCNAITMLLVGQNVERKTDERQRSFPEA